MAVEKLLEWTGSSPEESPQIPGSRFPRKRAPQAVSDDPGPDGSALDDPGEGKAHWLQPWTAYSQLAIVLAGVASSTVMEDITISHLA